MQYTLAAGTTSKPIEVGRGTRVTVTGGYIQSTTSTLARCLSEPGGITWTDWPAGAVAGTNDALRSFVIRAVATSACTLTVTEGFNDNAADDDELWQDGGTLGLSDEAIAAAVATDSQNTQTIYVSTTGSDSAAGTSDAPLATLQAAVDAITRIGSTSVRAVIINLAAGTYDGDVEYPENTWSADRVTIQGPSVTHPTVPTAILSTGTNGLVFNGKNNVYLKNVRLTGFSEAGIAAQDGCDVYTDNVHVDDCGDGIRAFGCRVRIKGGIIDGCAVGLTMIGGTQYTIGYGATSLSDGPQVTGCSQAGILVQENASGHLDYVTSDANVIGVDIVGSSRAHALGCDIKNNTTAGVRCRMASHWYNNSTTLSGNTVDEIYSSFSQEIGRAGSYATEVRSVYDSAQQAHTGTTSETTLKTYSNLIKGTSYLSAGRGLRVRVYATLAGGSGTKTLRVKIGGNLVAGIVSAVSSTGMVLWESRLMTVSASSQRYTSHLFDNSAAVSVKADIGSRSINLSTLGTVSLTVTGELSSSGDSITINEVEVWEV